MMLRPALSTFYSTITSPELAKSREAKDTAFLQAVNSVVGSENDKYSNFYQWVAAEVCYYKHTSPKANLILTSDYW
jgi:hypothetical protein